MFQRPFNCDNRYFNETFGRAVYQYKRFVCQQRQTSGNVYMKRVIIQLIVKLERITFGIIIAIVITSVWNYLITKILSYNCRKITFIPNFNVFIIQKELLWHEAKIMQFLYIIRANNTYRFSSL